jgi:hypothetical protein
VRRYPIPIEKDAGHTPFLAESERRTLSLERGGDEIAEAQLLFGPKGEGEERVMIEFAPARGGDSRCFRLPAHEGSLLT